MLKRRQPALERLCASRARSSNCFDELSFKKKEEKEMEGGAYITGCLLTKPSWLFAPPVRFLFIIIDLLLKKLLTIKMKDDRLSTQEDRESHIREKVTNRVEPSNIAKA